MNGQYRELRGASQGVSANRANRSGLRGRFSRRRKQVSGRPRKGYASHEGSCPQRSGTEKTLHREDPWSATVPAPGRSTGSRSSRSATPARHLHIWRKTETHSPPPHSRTSPSRTGRTRTNTNGTIVRSPAFTREPAGGGLVENRARPLTSPRPHPAWIALEVQGLPPPAPRPTGLTTACEGAAKRVPHSRPAGASPPPASGNTFVGLSNGRLPLRCRCPPAAPRCRWHRTGK